MRCHLPSPQILLFLSRYLLKCWNPSASDHAPNVCSMVNKRLLPFYFQNILLIHASVPLLRPGRVKEKNRLTGGGKGVKEKRGFPSLVHRQSIILGFSSPLSLASCQPAPVTNDFPLTLLP